MRLALISLIALAGVTQAVAQETAPSPPPAPPAASPPPPPAPPSPPTAPPTEQPPAGATPPAAAPPAPPAPPTDPAAIGVLSALDTVCVPVVSGGDLAKLAKSAGFHKSGDNWVNKQKTYQLTILALGSNPTQCHVDIIHPVDPEAPAKPIVVALHDWAAVSRGYSLYRNDKNVSGGQEFTTRSWENDENGKHEALVLTTIRKADGTPSKGSQDTSEMIFSQTATAAAS